jgi:hypothetical protein
MVTAGPLLRVLIRSPLCTPAPTLIPEKCTPAPSIEENAKYARDVIVEMPVIQLEVTKLAKEVVPETPSIQAKQASFQRRLSRKFKTSVVVEMIVGEPPTVPQVVAQNEFVAVAR